MSLERESEHYGAKLAELLTDEGKFVVIGGEEIAGVWQTYEDALKFGYTRFGLESFLVKQIRAIEPVIHFTRELPRRVS